MRSKRCWQLVVFFLPGMVWLACGESTNGNPPPLDMSPGSEAPASMNDQGPPPPADGGGGQGCKCKPEEVCDSSGHCIPKPVSKPGEIVGELVLLRQVRPGGTSLMDNLGKGEAQFWDQETLPPDTRQAHATPTGETCYFEVSTIWPHSLANGAYWPTGPGRGAGTLTFRAGAGPIELDPLDVGTPPQQSFAYFHDDVPPPLKDGALTLSDFFDVKHLPFGAQFLVEVAGGPDIGKQVFQNGEVPRTFVIDKPAVEQSEVKAPANQPLEVKWSPAQPNAVMEIFLTQDYGMGDFALLSCKVEDDGALTVPAAAMSHFGSGMVGVQLRRSVIRYQKSSALKGKVLHLYLIGRHARVAQNKVMLGL